VDLSEDALVRILSLLEIDEVYATMRVNKVLFVVATSDSLWQILCERDFVFTTVKVGMSHYKAKKEEQLKKVKEFERWTSARIQSGAHGNCHRNSSEHVVAMVLRGELNNLISTIQSRKETTDDIPTYVNARSVYNFWEYFGNYSATHYAGIIVPSQEIQDRWEVIEQEAEILQQIQEKRDKQLETGIYDETEENAYKRIEARRESHSIYLIDGNAPRFKATRVVCYKGTLLHWACLKGHDLIVKYLISIGADPNCYLQKYDRDSSVVEEIPVTAADIALQNGYPALAQYLKKLQKDPLL